MYSKKQASTVTVLLEHLDLLYNFYVHFTKIAPIMPPFCSLLLPTHYAKIFTGKINTFLPAPYVPLVSKLESRLE